MILGLSAAGMAWTATQASEPLGLILDLTARSSLGAALYATVVLGLWFAARRPDGAERYFLGIVRSWCRRFGLVRLAP